MNRAHIEVAHLFQTKGFIVSIYSNKTELYNFVGQDIAELISKANIWAANQNLRIVCTFNPFN
jgi:hypothetical protein